MLDVACDILGFHRWRVMSPGIAMEMSNIWTRHWNGYSSTAKYVIWSNELSFCYVPLLYIFHFSIILFWGVKWNIKVTFLLFSTSVWNENPLPSLMWKNPSSTLLGKKKLWIECLLQVMRFVYSNNIYYISSSNQWKHI